MPVAPGHVLTLLSPGPRGAGREGEDEASSMLAGLKEEGAMAAATGVPGARGGGGTKAGRKAMEDGPAETGTGEEGEGGEDSVREEEAVGGGAGGGGGEREGKKGRKGRRKKDDGWYVKRGVSWHSRHRRVLVVVQGGGAGSRPTRTGPARQLRARPHPPSQLGASCEE